MDYNKITVTLESTGEEIVLYENEKFSNFNELERICGERYDEINDLLMDGPKANGSSYKETIYENGEVKETLVFKYLR